MDFLIFIALFIVSFLFVFYVIPTILSRIWKIQIHKVPEENSRKEILIHRMIYIGMIVIYFSISIFWPLPNREVIAAIWGVIGVFILGTQIVLQELKHFPSSKQYWITIVQIMCAAGILILVMYVRFSD